VDNVLIDGFYLSGIGTLVVFLVLILLLISIKIITFFENKNNLDELEISQNSVKQNKTKGLINIAAAMAVGLYKKEKTNLNDVAAAVAVSLYKKDNLSESKLVEPYLVESSWVTINRSRMLSRKNRRI